MREDLKNIVEDLKCKFDLDFEIKGNKIHNGEFNGYINEDERYEDVQELCENLCYYIEMEYDCFTDYSLIDENEIVIEIF